MKQRRLRDEQITDKIYSKLVIESEKIRQDYFSNGFLNDLSYLDELLKFISLNKKINTLPLEYLLHKYDENKINIAFRSDVDTGIWSIGEMARIFKKYELICDFYFLPTAYYYGVTSKNGNFIRYSGLLNYLNEIKNANQNIGLHNDVFFSEDPNEGINLLINEIDWLRKENFTIKSTTAHNSAWNNKLEGFSIFSEFNYSNFNNELYPDIKINYISMKQYGLVFEGNYPENVTKDFNQKDFDNYFQYKVQDPIRDLKWIANQFIYNPIFKSKYDIDIWLVKEDMWFIANRINNKVNFPLNKSEMLDYLLNLDGGSTIVFNIHPDYINKKL